MSHLFVALPLPEWIRHHLHERSQVVKMGYPFQKWTHPEDYHLTLFFFGKVAEHQLNEIFTRLEQVAAQPEITPFSLQIGKWGIFGREKQPRILWVGVEGDCDCLSALQSAIKQTMQQAGFPVEKRPFRPHITIAKKGKKPHFSLPLLQSKFALQSDTWNIQKMVLYRTHLESQPHYQEVAQFPLNFNK